MCIVEDPREFGKHETWIVAGDDDGLPSLTVQEVDDVLVAAAPQHRRACDLRPVDVEYGQDGAVTSRIEKCRELPGCGERTGFGLAVADDTGHRQVGPIECRAACVHQRVAQFSALVDAARGLNAHVARYTARRGELAAQSTDAVIVAGDVRIDLRVRPLEVGRRDERGTAMARAGDVEPVRVRGHDMPVEQRVDHRQTRAGTPVPEQPRLDVRGGQWFTQQRVLQQVDLCHRQVIRGRPPVEIEVEIFVRVHVLGHRASLRCAGLVCGVPLYCPPPM